MGCNGQLCMYDAARSRRPVEADKDTIKARVDANQLITTREIGLRLNLLKSIQFSKIFIYYTKTAFHFRKKKKRNYFPNNLIIQRQFLLIPSSCHYYIFFFHIYVLMSDLGQ